ncbi:unnamed protein product [Closterium sp. NIES-53]
MPVCHSHRSGVDIFALDYDAILAAMYALFVSAEGDCYLCVPPDPGIEAAALGASESALPGTALAEALHTFMLDSGASRCVRVRSGSSPLLVSLPVAPHSPFGTTALVTPPCHAFVACTPASFFLVFPDRERYFLLVVDDCTRYTTVFPLLTKGEVPDVLIPWTRAVRLQLRERFREDLPVLHIHSDIVGEFSSDLLRDFCCGEGILQSFTLPTSPQQNGIAERCIGLVMEVARTSMIHAAAPHFLWPFAVQYATHQLNLWPRVSLPETSPTLRWTGKFGDALFFRVWGSRAFVRDTFADKLSSRVIPCVFLGFPPDALGWQFYHPTSHCGAESGDAEPGGAEPGGTEPEGAEPGGAESEDAESGGAEPWGTAFAGGTAGASPRMSPRWEQLSPQQLREWFAQRTRLRSGAVGARGSAAGGIGAGGTGATILGGARVTTGAGGTGGAGATGLEGAHTRGTGVARARGVGGAGAGGARVGGTGVGGPGAGGDGVGGTGAGGARVGGTGVGGPGARGAGAGGARAGGTGAGGTVQQRPFFFLLQPSSLPPPDSVLR